MLDAVVIACIAHELTELIGSRVSRSAQPDPDMIGLELRRRDGLRVVLSLSCHARWARVHAVPGDMDKCRPTHFTTILDHHVTGSVLTAVRVPTWERIIELDFARRDMVQDIVTTTIIAEIMGKHANLIIRGHDGMILDAIKRIGPAQSRVRSVYPGVKYQQPPARTGHSPTSWNSTPGLDAGRITSWLIRDIQGMSPLWARELCFRSRIDPKTTADRLTSDQLSDLQRHLITTATAVVNKDFQPTGYLNTDGDLTTAWAFPQESASGTVITASMNELIAQFATTAIAEEKIRSQRHNIVRAVQDKLGHRQHKLQQSKRALADAKDSKRYRLWGELLTAYAHTISRGMTEAVLPDFNNPDHTHNIPLQPELGPIDNAQIWFNKYRRAQAVIRNRSQEVNRLEQEVSTLQQLLKNTEQADAGKLADIQTALSNGRTTRKQKQTSHQDSILRLKTPGGRQLLVGRNNKQNDIVTFTLAAEHDLWFHVRNMPGCHLIMRLPAASVEPQARCLEYAAGIAAFFSAGKTSTTVPVDYTRRRYVRRQPGSGPGQALYEQFKTITVRPVDPDAN